ncbi:hypothetical protein RhiirA5_369304 [Rhizophagus irregularis]|uniref:Uncharacterized protein n=2 Tax=Rhizophagus irregularis TaxID=588596 RepID=A0A2N0QDH9_9GLOM|nr:hypothetical protein RhiirA5_369304 [Rhizophagus irregularis]
MEAVPEFINLTDNDNALLEEFLKDNEEELLEYDEAFLEQLINQEDPRLLNAEVDNSILMQQLFDIQENKQKSNIFHAKSFIQACKTVQNEEIDECSSESDTEIEDENIDYESQEENESETHENESHIMDEILSTPLSSCVIIDTINGKLQTCGINSKKNISQLVGTWQIDTDNATKFLDGKINLGVCMSHFNYDQKNHSNQAKKLRKTEDSIVHKRRCLFCGKNYFFFSRGMNCRQHSWNVFNRNIQVACNGQFSCNALEACPNISNLVKEEFPNPRNFDEVRRLSLSSINFFTTTSTELDQNNTQLPTLFAFQILLKMNKISNIYSHFSELHISDAQWPDVGKKLAERIWKSRKELNENKTEIQNPASLENYHSAFPSYLTGFFGNLCKEIFKKKLKVSNIKLKSRNKLPKQLNEQQLTKTVTFFNSVLIEIAFPGLRVWFTQVLASLSRKPKLIQQFRRLLSTLQISGHTDSQERRLEKTRMKSIDPCQRLNKSENAWNLAVIDNIDFKEATFRYGNIFDTTRTSTHATLRMVFQHQMPFNLHENKDDENQITSPLELFGMNQVIRDTLDTFDSVLDDLLNVKIDSQGIAEYQTNFDMAIVHEKILNHVEHGCKPGGVPSSDEGIFESLQMYKRDLELTPEQYLDVVADEAIFRRIIKQKDNWPQLHPILGQWHTSKDMCSVLIVLFSSYGIFDLANFLGVKFLEKLESVVDYRSTVRVLELIWTAVALAIRIYIKKKNLNMHEIWESSEVVNSAFRIWYLYYQWAGIFKAHRIGIRVENYDLQKNALAAFGGLFASAAKTRYASSVCHFIGILEKFPRLEDKLRYAASIRIDHNEKRKRHFFAYDEALETFGVKFIKQNISGNVINMESLKLQIKSAQTERDQIGILLSEYLNDPTASTGNHAINQRYDAMWKLVNILLQEFDKTNESFLNNDMWKNVYRTQLTVEGVTRLKNCFPDGVIRMRAIYYEDVLKTRSIQSGRSKLGVPKLKILAFQKELKESTKNKKTTERTQTLDSQFQLNQLNAEGSNIVAQNENELQDTLESRKRKRKAKRIPNSEEESLLEPLILSQNEPTNEEIREKLNTLLDEWDLSRVKQHVQYRRKKRAVAVPFGETSEVRKE